MTTVNQNPFEAYNTALPVADYSENDVIITTTGLNETLRYYQDHPEVAFPEINKDFYQNCVKLNDVAAKALEKHFNAIKFGFNPYFTSICKYLSDRTTNPLTLVTIDKAFGFQARFIDITYVGQQYLQQLAAQARKA